MLRATGDQMAGLGEVIRLLLEKSWTLGVLLLVTGAGAWLASSRGQRLPPIVNEWDVPAALLGLALIALAIVNAALAKIGAALSARRTAAKDAVEALANLSTLNLEEFHALAEALDSGVTRISLHHGSVLADIWRKGLLIHKRRESPLQSICEIHPAILGVKNDIIERWKQDQRKGRVPKPIDQSTSWMG